MRLFLILVLCFLLVGFAEAQDSTNYQIALQRIREAEASEATELNLDNLHLSSLPPEIGSLSNLRHLLIQSNALTSLPPEIGNLSSLELLYLTYNQLETLPPEIGNLPELRYLRVDYNNLSSLPPEIGNLRNLVSLQLDHNELEILPAELGQLTQLCELGLSNNRLNSLPNTLAQIQPLNYSGNCYLQIYANPIAPHQLIQNEGSASIIAYLNNPLLWVLQRYIGLWLFWLFCIFCLYLWFRPKNRTNRQRFYASIWAVFSLSAFYGISIASAIFLRVILLHPVVLVLIFPPLLLLYIIWHNIRYGFKPLSILLIPLIIFVAVMVFGYFFECRGATMAWLIGTPFWFNLDCM